MKIVVLSGSPKGDLSVTLQSVRFIQRHTPEHAFDVIDIGQRIRSIAENDDKRARVMEKIAAADAVLWATPVYAFTVPAQLKRFIEMITAPEMADAFAGKPAGVITTSVHFFDHTAHNYLRAVCDDLAMKFCGSFSADSYDLLNSNERTRLLIFAEQFFTAIENRWYQSRVFPPVPKPSRNYAPATAPHPIESEKKIVLITDHTADTPGLAAMVDQLHRSFTRPPVKVNLCDVHVAGGCQGCIQCGFDHQCVYMGKDDLIGLYEETIKPADILFMAGSIRDRYLSYRWKEFFDRGFYNTHTPFLAGKQIGILVSGPLSHAAHLRQMLEAFAECQGANLVDIVTDEFEGDDEIDRSIATLAVRSVAMADAGYVRPSTFLGKGGMKVFRDDVYGRHRFVFQADHAYFEAHGLYDFPHDDKRAMDTNAFMFDLMKDADTREAIRKMLKTEMVKPHKKVVEKES